MFFFWNNTICPQRYFERYSLTRPILCWFKPLLACSYYSFFSRFILDLFNPFWACFLYQHEIFHSVHTHAHNTNKINCIRRSRSFHCNASIQCRLNWYGSNNCMVSHARERQKKSIIFSLGKYNLSTSIYQWICQCFRWIS